MIQTHESAIRIIDKVGPLTNPADRDHCLQYMIAVPLIYGRLTADDYSDAVAADPRIDNLRAKMTVEENRRYSADYLDPDKRSIANAMRVVFTDGTATDRVAVEYPLGHRRRRAEGLPLLLDKLRANLATRLPADRCAALLALADDAARLEGMRVSEFMGLFTVEN